MNCLGKNILILSLTALLLCPLCGCKRKDPIYELKPEVGEAEIAQIDTMEGEPRWMRVRKSEREKIMAEEMRKKRRQKDMMMYDNVVGWGKKR